MEYAEWEPYYSRIRDEFGYSYEEDRKAGELLAGLLKGKNPVDEERLRRIIRGKDVLIVGPFAKIDRRCTLIATDSSTGLCLDAGIVPDIIVTDLDGEVEREIEANELGSTILIHAHGDNTEAIREFLPLFSGPVGGTVQTEPIPPLMNFGGFTDGDRAAFIASALGAKSIFISGFDFENPIHKDGKDPKIKKKKLDWAKYLLSLLDVRFI